MDARSRARRLRVEQTLAEHRLWTRLRARQLDGCHFRRQSPIGGYVVDFVCRRRRLVVEVDGGQHAERREADAARTAWLERRGYKVVRFWNRDVLETVEGVVEAILAELRDRDPPPPARPPPRPSPCKGEGEQRGAPRR